MLDESLSWPIFVLSLPGDGGRRNPLVSQLEQYKLSYELVYGVDGRNGLPAEYEALIDRASTRLCLGRKMTDGEYACALSHRLIYLRIINERLPGAIILEDDTILLDTFPAFLRSRVFENYPLVLLDYAWGRAVRFTRHKTAVGALHRVATQCTMTNAYTVNCTVADKLVAATTPVTQPADWPCSLHSLGAWMAAPRVATHTPPGPGRISHLEISRKQATEEAEGAPANGHEDPREWLRRRLSVRVGRAKGER